MRNHVATTAGYPTLAPPTPLPMPRPVVAIATGRHAVAVHASRNCKEECYCASVLLLSLPLLLLLLPLFPLSPRLLPYPLVVMHAVPGLACKHCLCHGVGVTGSSYLL